MNSKGTSGKVVKFFTLIVGFISLIIYSHINPLKSQQPIYYPLINHLNPVGAALNTRLVISEILSNPVGSEPGHEWIEIYNRSSQSIDLEHHKIGDSESLGDLEGMYQFPEGSRIRPGQVMLIANQSVLFTQTNGFKPDFELSDSDQNVPDLEKYRKWSGGVINLNNSGDELLLLNQADNLLDAVSWGGSIFAFNPPAPFTEDGHSLERKPANSDSNRTDDWSILPEPQPGKVNLEMPTPQSSPTQTSTQPSCENITILISEVFYDPNFSPEPAGEWIELFNFGIYNLSLDCILLGDEETIGGGEGMQRFPPGNSLLPGEVIVIVNQADVFINTYGLSPDYELIDTNTDVPDLMSSTDWATGNLNLNNSGDEVLVIDMNGNRIDEVSWGDSVYAFNPSVHGVEPGHSISRQPANVDTDSAHDWLEQSNPQPGIVQLTPPLPPPSPTKETPSPLPPSPTNTITPTLTVTPQPQIHLVINEIHADPDPDFGDANFDGDVDASDDEFIEIVNNSQTLIDLSNWALGDVLQIRHTFHDGSIILPNCGLLVFGGGNPIGDFGNSPVQIASSGSLSLNDHGDVIYIYDEHLTVIASLSYGEEAVDDQSITRDPDIIGGLPLIKHSLATDSNGALFSPGTQINGINFSGCPE